MAAEFLKQTNSAVSFYVGADAKLWSGRSLLKSATASPSEAAATVKLLPWGLSAHHFPWLRLRRAGLLVLAGAVSVAVVISASPGFSSGGGAAQERLIYTKILKGSNPAYEKIAVSSSGTGAYDGRALTDSPNPQSFKLNPLITQKLFALAARLHDFQGLSLESRKRVADLGQKTFEYQNGSQVYRVEFNYSLNRTAQALTDLFESIGTVERHILALDYAMRYDRLGLPRQLDLIQDDLNDHALADPQLMVAALQQIINDPRYLHLAQVRAENILRQIELKN